ncbi:MAG: GNAT family N-acetyltransferase [Candidatus Margulisiibacteriota bacterium]
MDNIYNIASKYDLESNDMKAEDFIVAEEKGRIIGFGRLWEHDGAVELGTVGVVEEYRGKGAAKMIIKALLKRHNVNAVRERHLPIYLTTLIPKFFEQFGFKRLTTPPPQSMIRKKEWCEGCAKVGCTVMKLDGRRDKRR